jgi:two-component system sensor histidine kinase YesM
MINHKRFWSRLGKTFGDLPLQKKLVLSYVFLITLPILLFSAATVSRVATQLERSLLFSSNQIFDQTYDVISNSLDQVDAISDAIILNASIANTISKSPESYPIYDQLGDMHKLSSYLQAFNRGNRVTNIALYVNSEYLYASESIRFLSLADAARSAWYQQMAANGVHSLWCGSASLEAQSEIGNNTLAFIRTVQDPNNYAQTVGYLRVDFDKQMLLDTLQRSTPTPHSVSFLQSSSGELILASNDTAEQYCTFTSSEPWFTPSESLRSIQAGEVNTRIYVRSAPLETSGWYLVTIIPRKDVRVGGKEITLFLLAVLAILGCISYALAQGISKSMTRRVTLLASHMNVAQNGELQELPESELHDEIGQLIHSYNYMVQQQKMLMEEKYRLGESAKMAELRALQSQINPHFLYNTLDLVKWMAIKGDISEVEVTIKALADFYKCSLNQGKDVVTVAEELRHVRLYHQIQNLRFKQKIMLSIDVPEAFLCCKIPKITFQSLVENAILHGILGKESKSGQIRITGCQNGNEILFCIQDNGIGMLPEERDAMLSSEGHGYGIRNIVERLRLFYGDAFQFVCHSELGLGTRVELHIPYAFFCRSNNDTEREDEP